MRQTQVRSSLTLNSSQFPALILGELFGGFGMIWTYSFTPKMRLSPKVFIRFGRQIAGIQVTQLALMRCVEFPGTATRRCVPMFDHYCAFLRTLAIKTVWQRPSVDQLLRKFCGTRHWLLAFSFGYLTFVWLEKNQSLNPNIAIKHPLAFPYC